MTNTGQKKIAIIRPYSDCVKYVFLYLNGPPPTVVFTQRSHQMRQECQAHLAGASPYDVKLERKVFACLKIACCKKKRIYDLRYIHVRLCLKLGAVSCDSCLELKCLPCAQTHSFHPTAWNLSTPHLATKEAKLVGTLSRRH